MLKHDISEATPLMSSKRLFRTYDQSTCKVLCIYYIAFPQAVTTLKINMICAMVAYLRPILDRSIIGIQLDGVADYIMSQADNVPSLNHVSCLSLFASFFGGRLERNGI